MGSCIKLISDLSDKGTAQENAIYSIIAMSYVLLLQYGTWKKKVTVHRVYACLYAYLYQAYIHSVLAPVHNLFLPHTVDHKYTMYQHKAAITS